MNHLEGDQDPPNDRKKKNTWVGRRKKKRAMSDEQAAQSQFLVFTTIFLGITCVMHTTARATKNFARTMNDSNVSPRSGRGRIETGRGDSVPRGSKRSRCRQRAPRSTLVLATISLACLIGLVCDASSSRNRVSGMLPGVFAFSSEPSRLSGVGRYVATKQVQQPLRNKRSNRRSASPQKFSPCVLQTSTMPGRFATRISASAQEGDDEPLLSTKYSYGIRDCQYRELKQVAALVVNSFYDNKKTNVVARNLFRLAELNRLQQNYAYPESRSVHRMLVVEATPLDFSSRDGSLPDCEIVGFCDVDARPCATKLKLPRPYLSDLAVDPNHRRRGLARKLVEECEQFVLDLDESDLDSNGEDSSETSERSRHELWIRVAEDNAAAIGLYRDRMGYVRTPWSVVGQSSLPVDTQTQILFKEQATKEDEPAIWTLRKDLGGTTEVRNEDDDSTNGIGSSFDAKTIEIQDNFVI